MKKIVLAVFFGISLLSQATNYTFTGGDLADPSNWTGGPTPTFNAGGDDFNLNGVTPSSISASIDFGNSINGSTFRNSGAAVILNIPSPNILKFYGAVDADNISAGSIFETYYFATGEVIPGTYLTAMVIGDGTTGITCTAIGDITITTDVEVKTSSVLDMKTYELDVLADNLVAGVTGEIHTQRTGTDPIKIGSGFTWKSKIVFNASGAQSVPSDTYEGGLSIEGGTSTADQKTVAGNITVHSTLNITGRLQLDDKQLLDGSSPFTVSGTGQMETKLAHASNLPFPSGKDWDDITVYFAATPTATQLWPAGTYESVAEVVPNNTLKALGDITVNSQIGDLGGTLDMGTYQLSGAFSVNNFGINGIFRTENTGATPIPTGITFGSGFTVEFYATGAQTIPSNTYNKLKLSGSGNKTASGAITVATLDFDGGDLFMSTHQLIDNAGAFTSTVTSGTPTLTTACVSSSPAIPSAKDWTGVILHFAGIGADQEINVSKCAELKISQFAKTLNANIEITNKLEISGTTLLDAGSYAITGAFTSIVGGNTGELFTENNSTTPLPLGLDWSDLKQVEYRNPCPVIVGGTYNELDIGGTDRTIATTGNIDCENLFIGVASGTRTYTLNVPADYYINATDKEFVANATTTINLRATSATTYAQYKIANSIVYGSGSLTINKEYYVDLSSPRWFHMSTGLSGADLQDLNSGGIMVSANNTTGSVWEWDADSSVWTNPSLTGNTETTGYAIYGGTESGNAFLSSTTGGVVLDITGTPKTGTVSAGLKYNDGQSTSVTFAGGTDMPATEGWNLLANPYLSNYDWDNSTKQHGINAYYVYNGTNYLTRSGGVGAAGQYIAPGQGIFLQVSGQTNGWTGSLDFSSAQAVPNSSGTFRKAGTAQDYLSVHFQEVNGPHHDELFIRFEPTATDSFDLQFDARKLVNAPSVPNAYIDLGGSYHSICATHTQTTVFPVRFNDADNNQVFEVSINEDQLVSYSKVYIKDKKTHTTVEISNGNSYIFTHDVQFGEDRFEIHFSESTIDLEEMEKEKFSAFFGTDELTIISNSEFDGNVSGKLLDLQGRVVHTFKTEASRIMHVQLPSLTSGVYILYLENNGSVLGSEKMLKM